MLEEDYRQAGGQAEIADEPIPDMDDLYELTPHMHQQYKRYYSGRMKCSLRFIDTTKMNDCYDLVPMVWDHILDHLFRHLEPDDKVGLAIHHPSLTDPIHLPLTEMNKLNGFKIAQKVAKIQQSKKELK